eukprot:sb/3466564/
MVSHKPGPLKQPKKTHKHGKHKSKGALNLKNKGRVGVVKKGGIKGMVTSKLDRFHFLTPRAGCPLFETIDLVKCADLVVVVWDHTCELDPLIKTCLYAQGLPSVQHVVVGGATLTEQERAQRRRIMGETLEALLGNKEDKVEGVQSVKWVQLVSSTFQGARYEGVHYLDKASDVDTMIWNMANFKHHRLSFLRHRPYMVSSEVDFKQTSEDKGTLQVTGYLRGGELDANMLIHIPGLGHFPLDKITTAADPMRHKHDMFEDSVLSERDVEQCQNPDMECPIDEMDGEQTWPTEEELMEAENEKKSSRKVPKGTPSPLPLPFISHSCIRAFVQWP